MLRSLLLTLIAFATSVSTAYADGLIFQLPKDGTWVQFNTDGSEIDGRDGDKEEFGGTITVSSVGTKTVKGEKCRWIEIRHTWQKSTRGDTDDRVRILKCLIPEKHLGRGKTPSKHVVRGWRVGYLGSKGKGRPHGVRRSDGSMDFGQPGGMILGGPLKNSKKLKAKSISTKLGKFQCKGLTGTFDVKLGKRTAPYTLTVWLNEKVPFGVVRFKMVGKEPDGDVITFSGTVLAKGTRAESELPKNQ